MDYAKLAAAVLEDNKTAWVLARHVSVSDPDNINSPGAAFLYKIRDAILDEAQRILEAAYPQDEVSEIADSAAEIVSTYEIWQTYIDLELYNWDSSMYGDDETVKRGDITQYAQGVLWEVASDLANIIYQELDTAYQEAADAEANEHIESILEMLNQHSDL